MSKRSYIPVSQDDTWVGGGGAMGSGLKRTGSFSRLSASSKKRAITTFKGVKKTPKQVISKVVRDLAEKKQSNTDPVDFSFNANNSTMSGPNDIGSAYKIISQGSGNGQRVGNKIYVHDYSIRMNFLMNPTYVSSATFRPGFVQVWIGTLKDNPGATPTATDLTRIYDDGNGTASADGTMLNTLRDTNRDYFNIVAYRKFKLGSAGAVSGGASGVPLYPNNDFPIQKSIVIRNLLKGRVVYNDTFAFGNKSLYMWYTFTTIDSVILTVTVPVLGQFYVNCKYSDL